MLTRVNTGKREITKGENTMDLIQLLGSSKEEVIRVAQSSLHRAQLMHYEEDGCELSENRLSTLYDVIVKCVQDKNAIAMIKYMEQVGYERYYAGYNLHEVNTAILVLEVAVIKKIINGLKRSEIEEAVGMIIPIINFGKDALSQKYLSLASRMKAPSYEVSTLFKGTDGV